MTALFLALRLVKEELVAKQELADFKAGDIEATGQLTAVGPLSLGNLRVDADDSVTTTSTTEATLDTFSLLAYRSGKYHLQATSGSNYHATEVMVIHDGSNAYFSHNYVTLKTK